MRNRDAELAAPASGRRNIWVSSTLLLIIGLAGCGGGGGDDVPSGEPPPSGSTGSIRVKVTDELGEVVAGASVSVFATKTTSLIARLVTGSDGTVRFDSVPTEELDVCASQPVRGDACSEVVTVETDKVLDLTLQLTRDRWADAAAAVLSATVDPGGVSADGSSLDVTLRVAVSGPTSSGSWFLGDQASGDRTQVLDCHARSGDELAQLGPRCIRGAGGSDASYSFGQILDLGTVRSVEYPRDSWGVGLLIDQSAAGLSPLWPPNDPRLFAAKVFSDRLLPATPLLLAGFASDEPSGSASRLPQRPVTYFPVESPAFLTSRAGAFAVLDDLSDLVGGGAPLYEAIAEAVDYLAARTPSERQRALVVLGGGVDTTCGAPASCAALRREIIDRARNADVQLFVVAQSRSCLPDYEDCARFPEDTDSAVLLAREGGFPLALSDPLGLELARQWLAGSMTVQDIRLRLTSDSEGAFAPGATVMGTFNGWTAPCPMGCYPRSLSFSVEVP